MRKTTQNHRLLRLHGMTRIWSYQLPVITNRVQRGVSINGGAQNGWFMMDDLGVPLF